MTQPAQRTSRLEQLAHWVEEEMWRADGERINPDREVCLRVLGSVETEPGQWGRPISIAQETLIFMMRELEDQRLRR
jgi:hypothetical protein